MNFNPILLLSGLSATTIAIAAVVSIIAFVGYKAFRNFHSNENIDSNKDTSELRFKSKLGLNASSTSMKRKPAQLPENISTCRESPLKKYTNASSTPRMDIFFTENALLLSDTDRAYAEKLIKDGNKISIDKSGNIVTEDTITSHI